MFLLLRNLHYVSVISKPYCLPCTHNMVGDLEHPLQLATLEPVCSMGTWASAASKILYKGLLTTVPACAGVKSL